MGALAGIVFSNNEEDSALVNDMMRPMAHRGAQGSTIAYPISSFGVSGDSDDALAAQAVFDRERQLCVVLDGELTSFPADWDSQSKGAPSDAEMIRHLYLRDGIDFLDRVDGSFAFALWDGERRKLYLVRDRVGSKPLFYFRDGDAALFASEIKGLLASGRCPRQVDAATLNAFLSFGYVPNPSTLFQDIRQVRPGHYLEVSGRGTGEVCYWRFRYLEEPYAWSDEAFQEHFWEKMQNAVARRLKRHPRCGAFLSGGLDTSGVVAAMQEHLQHPFKVFTGAFPEPEYNETEDARVVADYFGLPHFVVDIEVDDFPGLLKKLVWHHDAPFADTSAIPSYFTAKYAREQVDTVLTGDFPDQLLGGSGHHAKALGREQADTLMYKLLRSSPLRSVCSRLSLSAGTTSLSDRVKRFVYRELHSIEEQRHILDMPVPDTLKQCLYSPGMLQVHKENDPLDLPRSIYGSCCRNDLLDRLLLFDTLSYAPDDLMVKVERMTAAHGLNALSPFHDRELVEFVACLPSHMKIRNGTRKYIMRQAFRPHLPRRTLEKKKKGFDMPIGEWLIKRYSDYVRDILFDRKAMERGYFQPKFLKELVNNFLSGKNDYATGSEAAIISLLTLELWHRVFIDG